MINKNGTISFGNFNDHSDNSRGRVYDPTEVE